MDFVSLRLIDGVVVALGDLILLFVLFRVLFIRDPRVRQALYGVGLLHCVGTLFGFSPWSLLSLRVFTDGTPSVFETAAFLDPILFAGWMSGAGLLLLRLLLRARKQARLLDGLALLLPSAPAEVDEHVAAVADDLGIEPPTVLWLTRVRCSPFVAGYRAPRLVLPAQLCGELDERAWLALLHHELLHVVHGDTRRRWLVEILRCVLFFNLPARFLLRGYERELEKSRDAEACAQGVQRDGLTHGLLSALEACRNMRDGSLSGPLVGTVPLVGSHAAGRLRWLAEGGGYWQKKWLILQVLFVLWLFPWQWAAHLHGAVVVRHPTARTAHASSSVWVGMSMSANPLFRSVLPKTVAAENLAPFGTLFRDLLIGDWPWRTLGLQRWNGGE